MASYFLYARKSEEKEDRQVLSIDSQVKELTDFARANNFNIKHVFKEAHSAKAPGRPVFTQVLSRLTKGEVAGVVCWKLDRLARNPVDGGALIWAMDQGQLQEIVTPGRTFVNTGQDKFWMQLEFGMAKKYVDDLSDNIRRGNRAKLELGWLPGRPPLGYLNDPINHTIISDPDRFHLVQQLFKLILAGDPPLRVLERATHVWGLRTRISRKRGGSPLHPSVFYAMLADPFYCGIIDRAGSTHKGAHELMITPQEFEEIQRLLGRANHTDARVLEFAYTGLIRCGECGASITAEEKLNRQGHRYTYYHCTFKKLGTRCAQRSYLRLEALEDQIAEFLGRYHLPDRYHQWLLNYYGELSTEAAEVARQARASLESAHSQSRGKLSELTDLRIKRLLTDEEFEEKRKSLLMEQTRLERQKADVVANQAGWFEPVSRALSFANQAVKCFKEGDSHLRRQIFATLCSNPVLQDKVLRTEAKKPFLLLEKGLHVLEWCTIADQLRTFFLESPEYFVIPDELVSEDLKSKYQNQRKEQGGRR